MRRLMNPAVDYADGPGAVVGRVPGTHSGSRPADPTLLGLLRILTGLMLLYTHAVWGLVLGDFFGPAGWLSPELVRAIQQDQYTYSFWWLVPAGGMWPAYGVSHGDPGAVHGGALHPPDLGPVARWS